MGLMNCMGDFLTKFAAVFGQMENKFYAIYSMIHDSPWIFI